LLLNVDPSLPHPGVKAKTATHTDPTRAKERAIKVSSSDCRRPSTVSFSLRHVRSRLPGDPRRERRRRVRMAVVRRMDLDVAALDVALDVVDHRARLLRRRVVHLADRVVVVV